MSFQLIPVLEESVAEIHVTTPRLSIGRSKDCDIRLQNCSVSRLHCELITEGEELFVRDLDSSNGTFVNNRRVYDEHPLQDGDLVALANSVFKVEVAPRASELPSPYV